jgi:hypothetical protein
MAGRKPFEPSQEQRTTVAIAAACGLPHPHICERIINYQTGKPIDAKTLVKVFESELKEGRKYACALVRQNLFKQAVSNTPHSVRAAHLWLAQYDDDWKSMKAEVSDKDVTITVVNGLPQD